MRYVAFIGTEGAMPDEALEVMRRGFPAYLEEMDRRGVRLGGRELDFPPTAATVRVRDGRSLVTDGPYAETKEFVGGIDVLECADLSEAIEVEAKSPVARFLPFEIRPVQGEARLGPGMPAFADGDDSAGIPYLLAVWADRTSAAPVGDAAVIDACTDWRREREDRGVLIMGCALDAPETATTLRFRDGATELSDGPFLDVEQHIAAVEVVRCTDRREAIGLAARHPLARSHAVEVRPFAGG